MSICVTYEATLLQRKNAIFLRIPVFAVRILLCKQSEFVAHMEHGNWLARYATNEIYLHLKLSQQQQRQIGLHSKAMTQSARYILNCIAEMLNVYNLMSIVG